MNKIIGLLLLVTISNIPSVYAEAYFANFFSHDFGPLSSDSCWKDDNSFNDSICLKEEIPCSFEGWAENFEKTSLVFKILQDEMIKNITTNEGEIRLQTHIPGSSSYGFHRYSINSKNITDEKYPKNSPITIYREIEKHRETGYKILYQGKIPENGEISNLADRPYSLELYLKKEESIKDDRLELHILGDYSGNIEGKFLLSAGSYPIIIENTTKKTYFETTLTVKESKDIQKKTLTISPDTFKPILKKINWDYDELTSKTPRLKLTWMKEYNEDQIHLKEIKEFQINKKNNLRNLFEIIEGKPYVIKGYEKNFNEFIARYPTYKMQLKGICFKTKPKDTEKMFPIKKESADNSEDLGKIIVGYSRHHNSVKFSYESNQGIREELKSLHYFDTNCRGERDVSGWIVVKHVNGSFVNLGSGPWGSPAWIELPYEKINSWGSVFSFGELNNVSFRNSTEGMYLVEGNDIDRSETPIIEAGDESPEVKSSFKLEKERLWDKNGNFIPSFDCSYGC